jgi:hypothetical protein
MAGIRYQVTRPVGPIYTFEGQEKPIHYPAGVEITIEESLHGRDEDGRLTLPGKRLARCLERVSHGSKKAESGSSGQTDPSRVLTIQRAVGDLDDANDDHWTKQRTPAVHIVNELAGNPEPPIRAAEIRTLCPGAVRGVGNRGAVHG